MASYRRVSPKFWQDPVVRGWSDQQKLFAQYVLTCPQRNTEGLFWLPKAYMATDLGWTLDKVETVLHDIARSGFMEYDDATETLWICKALRYQSPAGERQLAGAVNALADVPATPLFARFHEMCRDLCPTLAEKLDAAIEGPCKHHRRSFDTPSEGYPPQLYSSPSQTPPPLAADDDESGEDETTPQAPGVGDLRTRQALTMWADNAVREKQRSNDPPNDPDGWRAWFVNKYGDKATREAADYVRRFPDITASQLADVLAGKREILKYLRRAS